MIPPAHLLPIVAGGALGTAARAGLLWAFPAAETAFPLTVFLENLSGAFLLGLLLGWLGRRPGPSLWRSPFFTTGALGSFTTFSALSADVASLLSSAPWLAVANAALSLVLGLGAAGVGWALGQRGGGR